MEAFYDNIKFATASDGPKDVAAGQTTSFDINMDLAASPDFFIVSNLSEWDAARTAIAGGGNNNTFSETGGVAVYGGTFTMSGNASVHGNYLIGTALGGGGVYIEGGSPGGNLRRFQHRFPRHTTYDFFHRQHN